MSKPRMVRLDQIEIDGGTQPRADIDTDVVSDYQAAIESGAEMPAAVVFCDSAEYWLAAGFHRYFAYKRAGRDQMLCEVREGTREDAVWYAVSTNQTHGLRRSNADKEKAVRMALKHPRGAEATDTVIAEHVGVSDKTVAKYRAELESTSEIPKSTKRTGRDGRTIDTANIGAPAEPELESTSEIPKSEDEGPLCEGEGEGEDEGYPDNPPADPFGVPWSDSALVDIHEAVAIKQDAAELARIAREWAKLADVTYLVTKFELAALKRHLNTAKQLLESATPYAMCECSGAGCDRCQQAGWLTQSQYEAAEEPAANADGVPDELNTPEFHKAWKEWKKHRAEIKKKITPRTRMKQLKLLAGFGVERAIRSIDLSITSGWTGLFDPDEKAAGAKKPGKGQRHEDDASVQDGYF